MIIFVIPGVAKWHVVLFESVLLMKIATISMLFVFKWYHNGVLLESATLFEENVVPAGICSH